MNEDNARNISIQFELRQIAFRTKDARLVTRGKFNLVCEKNLLKQKVNFFLLLAMELHETTMGSK